MIIVSDTSPLTALLTIGKADLLPELFGIVVIPEAVCHELLRTHSKLPHCLQVQRLNHQSQMMIYKQTVDVGEAEAIALANELHADLFIN